MVGALYTTTVRITGLRTVQEQLAARGDLAAGPQHHVHLPCMLTRAERTYISTQL